MRPRSAIVVFALLLACAPDREPIVLGAAGPWTEAFGLMNKRGIDLALEEVNARAGINGRQLRIEMRDDQGEGARAAAIAGEFVANRAIVAVIGHVTSGAMVAAAGVYNTGLPAVSTTASSPDLTGVSPWVFRVISSDSVNGMDMARFAVSQGFRKAAILYENTAYGRGLIEAFRRSFSGTVVSSDPIPSDAGADFEPYVAYLRDKAPDVVLVAGTDGSGMAVLREARRQGLKSAFLGGDGWTGIVADTAAAEGAFVGALFSADDTRPEAQRFVNAFRTRYRVEPDGNAALAYDATMLLARAIQDAGPQRRAIRDWLAALGTEQPFAGVTGPIRFSADGDVVGKGILLTRVQHGTLTIVREGSRS